MPLATGAILPPRENNRFFSFPLFKSSTQRRSPYTHLSSKLYPLTVKAPASQKPKAGGYLPPLLPTPHPPDNQPVPSPSPPYRQYLSIPYPLLLSCCLSELFSILIPSRAICPERLCFIRCGASKLLAVSHAEQDALHLHSFSQVVPSASNASTPLPLHGSHSSSSFKTVRCH